MDTWKLSVVGLASLTGVYLGFLGYHAPAIGGNAILTAGAAGGAAAGTAAGTKTGHRNGGAAPPAGTARAASGAGTAAGHNPAKATASSKGPLLSSTRWWPYAHQLYPASPSASTRVALTGFTVAFSQAAGGLERVQVGTGRGKPQTATFRQSDRLYMIEGGMGDDGLHQDTNFGDDAFVLTDSGGHIVGK